MLSWSSFYQSLSGISLEAVVTSLCSVAPGRCLRFSVKGKLLALHSHLLTELNSIILISFEHEWHHTCQNAWLLNLSLNLFLWMVKCCMKYISGVYSQFLLEVSESNLFQIVTCFSWIKNHNTTSRKRYSRSKQPMLCWCLTQQLWSVSELRLPPASLEK